MSFFILRKNKTYTNDYLLNKKDIKKISLRQHIKESYLLWGFACILAVTCIFLNSYNPDLPEKKQSNIYQYTWDGKNIKESDQAEAVSDNVETVDGTVSTAGKQIADLNAKYALLMDASNRRVLYEKSGYEQVPMASTTKIMTLIVALENGNLSDVVTISDYAASMPDVQLNMKSGEQYILSDLLYSLMLESHNDTAVAIAEHIGGSVEGFAALMNEKARELGAYHTNFVTSNGLDAEGHYTTAYDLALISSYAIENDTFLKIVQTSSHTFHEQTTGRCFTVNNKDKFLTSYEGAIGIKTGFTNNAGYCFVGAATRENKTFIGVVLACGWPPNKNYKWKDITQMMNYGMENYSVKEIVTTGTSFQQIPITDSIEGGTITPYVDESVSLLLREDEKVDFDIKLPTVLVAPIKKNETIGEITVYINDEIYKVLPLYSLESKSKITYEYVLRKIFYQYFLVFTG